MTVGEKGKLPKEEKDSILYKAQDIAGEKGCKGMLWIYTRMTQNCITRDWQRERGMHALTAEHLVVPR